MKNFIVLSMISKEKSPVLFSPRRFLILLTSLMVMLSICMPPLSISHAQNEELPVYIVQAGDTLSTIALRFNVSAEDLIAVNGITDANFVNVGDRLKVPGLEGISGELVSQVIPLGVTLSSLSKMSGASASDLVTLNKLTSPNEIIAGAKIIVPVTESSESIVYLNNYEVDNSSLAYAIKNRTSPWIIKEANDLPNTIDLYANEVYIKKSDGEDVVSLAPIFWDLALSPLPLVQGKTTKIEVSTGIAVDVNASFDGQPIPIFRMDDDNTYIALFGVHAMQSPGAYPMNFRLSLPTGSVFEMDQLVLVTEGGYLNDPEIYVNDVYVDPATILEEDTIISQIVSGITPTIYWDGRFQSPIADPSCIVGYYGNRRSYNDGALLYYHTGIDFNVCVAENLYAYAPANGQVVFAQSTIIRGNAVIIDHGQGVYTGYWHLSEINVSPGDMLTTGDLIGTIGNTGRSAGPHLHFELIVNSVPVDPTDWLSRTYP